MRILLAAPHPFYQERGTPIAVDLLLRVLCERGDTVDVLTFHEGKDRSYPGVTVHRISAPPGVRDVGPGPSWKKVICDLYFFVGMIRLLRRNQYDVIHAVEESAFMAMLLKPMTGVPFIYDMDSALSTQIVDKYPLLRPFRPLLRGLESLPIRTAAAVVPVCEALAEEVRKRRTNNVVVLKDISLLDSAPPVSEGPSLREELGISGSVSMYIGNLEPYQGIDLLLESFARLRSTVRTASLVVIGGAAGDVDRYTARAEGLGVRRVVHFLGPKPVEQLGLFMAQADVLVSPRIRGVNTPMKVYSYLHSAVPVLATDLPTHNQVVTQDIARLAPAAVGSFAEAWRDLLENREAALAMGQRAQAFIEREHSYNAFRTTVNALYDGLDQGPHHRYSQDTGGLNHR